MCLRCISTSHPCYTTDTLTNAHGRFTLRSCRPDASEVRETHWTRQHNLAERSEKDMFPCFVLRLCVEPTARSTPRDGSPRCPEQGCPNAVPHGTHGSLHGGHAVGSCLRTTSHPEHWHPPNQSMAPSRIGQAGRH